MVGQPEIQHHFTSNPPTPAVTVGLPLPHATPPRRSNATELLTTPRCSPSYASTQTEQSTSGKGQGNTVPTFSSTIYLKCSSRNVRWESGPTATTSGIYEYRGEGPLQTPYTNTRRTLRTPPHIHRGSPPPYDYHALGDIECRH